MDARLYFGIFKCSLFRQALITTYAGFHPDAYWDRAEVVKRMKARASSDSGYTTTFVDDEAASSFIPVDDEPVLVSELPTKAAARNLTVRTMNNPVGTLEELRIQIDSQAKKIKDLQERVQKKEARSSRIHQQHLRTSMR